jgi:hypothetical protein
MPTAWPREGRGSRTASNDCDLSPPRYLLLSVRHRGSVHRSAQSIVHEPRLRFRARLPVYGYL